DPPAELLRVQAAVSPGPPGAVLDETGRAALRMFADLPDPLRSRVSGMATTPAGVDLTLDGRVAVHFGPPTDTGAKLIAFATLVERADLKGVTGMDLRVPTAPVLTK